MPSICSGRAGVNLAKNAAVAGQRRAGGPLDKAFEIRSRRGYISATANQGPRRPAGPDLRIDARPGVPKVHGADFLTRLDETISRRALLSHPFYQLWNRGELSMEALREYVKQYYAHVRVFPRYVSAAHSACDDIRVRQLLLENLIDE